jgi:hypothetical protein
MRLKKLQDISTLPSSTGFSFSAFSKKSNDVDGSTLDMTEPDIGKNDVNIANPKVKPTAFGFGSSQSSPFGKLATSEASNPFAAKGSTNAGFGFSSDSAANNPFAVSSTAKALAADSLKSAFPPSKPEAASDNIDDSITASPFSFAKPETTPAKLTETDQSKPASSFSFAKPDSTQAKPGSEPSKTASPFSFAKPDTTPAKLTEGEKPETNAPESSFSFEKPAAGLKKPVMASSPLVASFSFAQPTTAPAGMAQAEQPKSQLPFSFPKPDPTDTKSEDPAAAKTSDNLFGSIASKPTVQKIPVKSGFSFSQPAREVKPRDSVPKASTKSISIEDKNQVIVIN